MFKLNHFQKAMLVWQRHYPYNAVHAIRLRGRADVRTLRDAIEKISRSVGVGELIIDRLRGKYGYVPVFAPELNHWPASADSEYTFEQIINEAMNSGFPSVEHYPIRWYVFDDAGADSHFIVLVYDHVIADATAIEALLACVLEKYLHPSNGVAPITLNVQPPESVVRAKRPFLRFGFFRSYRRTIALSWRVFWSRRPRPESKGQDRTSMISRSAPEGLLARVRQACRRETSNSSAASVGLNDVFLAAMATAINARVEHEGVKRWTDRFWKPRIVLGTVLSQRPGAANDLSNFFGVCLHDVILFVDNPEDPVTRLASRIAVQSSAYKADAIAADAVSDMRLFLAKLSWPFLRNNRQSFRRMFPVWGGVSTVYVQQSRFGTVAPNIDRYIRACPPGPVMPMVLAPTIWGDRLELGFVYRHSSMDARTAAEMLDGILNAIIDFAESAEPREKRIVAPSKQLISTPG
jgi:hypothetical protein